MKGGGPTVKNVTGYDLPRLFVGSLGTIGVLQQATLAVPAAAPGARAGSRRRRRDGRRPFRPVGAPLGRRARSGAARRRRRRRRRAEPRPARRSTMPPALPDGAHRGRISVRARRRARVRARALDASRAVVRGARRRHDPRRDRLRRRARPRPRRRARARRLDVARSGRRRRRRRLRLCRCRTSTLMRRIKDAFDPDGRLNPAGCRSRLRSRWSAMTGPLQLDPDTLNACVSCGLCLPHCPTYRVTGREIASPRGRIAAMRAVEAGGAPIDDAFRAAMEECVSCRGCEAACPSGVQFGQLMERHTGRAPGAPLARAPRRGVARLRDRAAPALAAARDHVGRVVRPAPASRPGALRSPAALGAFAGPAARRSRRRQSRRVDVHRLRDGRVAARHAPRPRRAVMRATGSNAWPARRPAARAAARCICTPGEKPKRRALAAGSSRRCPARRRSSSTARGAARP